MGRLRLGGLLWVLVGGGALLLVVWLVLWVWTVERGLERWLAFVWLPF